MFMVTATRLGGCSGHIEEETGLETTVSESSQCNNLRSCFKGGVSYPIIKKKGWCELEKSSITYISATLFCTFVALKIIV